MLQTLIALASHKDNIRRRVWLPKRWLTFWIEAYKQSIWKRFQAVTKQLPAIIGFHEFIGQSQTMA
jgi:hypothetical protein